MSMWEAPGSGESSEKIQKLHLVAQKSLIDYIQHS